MLSSCTEKPTDNNLVKTYPGPLNNPPQIWENLNNPYDTMGYLHNEGLDYIISFRDDYDISDTLDLFSQIVDNNADYYCSLGWYSGQENCDLYATNASNNSLDIYHEMTISEITDSFSVDINAETELNGLYGIITKYEDSTQFDYLYSDVKAWESNVISSNYSTECKKQLLSVASIVRYSAHYWTVQTDLGEDNPWILVSNGIRVKSDYIQISWYDALGIAVVVAADGWGYAEGGLIGALVYSSVAAVLWWG